MSLFTGGTLFLFSSVYFICQVREIFDFNHYVSFTVMLIMSGLSGNAFGMLLGAVIDDPEISQNLVFVFFIPNIMIMGFVKNVCEMQSWVRWVT